MTARPGVGPLVDGAPRPVRARRVFTRIALELLPVAVVIGAVFFEMRHISRSLWSSILLYNGDSLVLPLLNQSMLRGEPFQWVFSSQTFFFPEYPIYWICSLIGHTPRVALVLNAFVNVLALYGLLRGIAAFAAPGRHPRQVLFSLLAVAIFIAFTLTEYLQSIIPPGIVPQPYIATLFLVSTYYYGVILVALSIILLSLWVTQGFQFNRPARLRIGVYGTVVLLMVVALTYSDPLFLLQFTVPFGTTILVLALTRRVQWRWLFFLLGLEAFAGIVGLLLRVVFARYIAFSVGDYLAPHRVIQALVVLATVVSIWLRQSGPLGVLKVLLLVALIGAALIYFVYFLTRLRKNSRSRRPAPRTIDVFVMTFIAAGTISLLAGQVATGQELTRYLIPLFIFPLMGVVLLADETSLGRRLVLPAAAARQRTLIAVVAAAASVGVAVTLTVISVPPTVSMIRNTQPPGQKCLDDWLGTSAANGVGSFMVTRPIALYGSQKGKLLQVVPGIGVQAWMNNLASYRNTDFSFVLVDKYVLTKSDVTGFLGRPRTVQSCGTFDIYDYAGTTGEASLNRLIVTNLNKYLVLRGYPLDRQSSKQRGELK
jgi:hypothetical protein